MATTFDKENRIRDVDHKIEKTAWRATFVSGTRKRLADISNIPQLSRPFNPEDYSQQCIEQLQKDNMALMSTVAEQNKTIEIMQINLQKFQLQNVQLAQANRQMLAELNSDKDRLKVLQHELACKNGLLKARNMEDKAKRSKFQKTGDEVGTAMFEKSDGFSLANRVNNIPGTNQEQYRDQSAGASTTKQVQSKEKADKKRLSLRRQSTRFREPECTEDLFDPDDLICPSRNDVQMDGNGYTYSIPFVKNDTNDANDSPGNGTVKIQSEFNPSDLVQKEDNKESFTAVGQSTTKQDQAKEKEDKKRHPSRRQPARFKSRESEDLFHSNVKFPSCPLHSDDQMDGNDCTSSVSLVTNDFEGGTKAPVKGMVEIRSALNSSDSLVQKEDEEELFTAMGPSTTKQVQMKEKADEKRLFSRRQSARFKSREPEGTDDVFDIEDAKFPVCLSHNDDQMAATVYTPSVSLLKGDFKEGINAPGNGTVENQNGSNPSGSLVLKEDLEGKELERRSSVGRPLRRAVERIHSYKEKPLNGKMRRSE